MTTARLVLRSIAHYWRPNLAVVAGTAVAVGVLTGALLVGHSVRASLAALVDARLGAADVAVSSPVPFRDALAADLAVSPGFGETFIGVAPLFALEGAVTHQASGRRAQRVAVYGIDARFWRFHGLEAHVTPPRGRSALVSPALARDLVIETGDSLLLIVQRHAAIPAETLTGRRDDTGRTIRLTASGVLPADRLGEFALRPAQGEVRAIFVPLDRLQRDLDQPGRANTLLLSARDRAGAGPDLTDRAVAALRSSAQLSDVGLRIRPLPRSGDAAALAVESEAGLLSDALAAAVHAVAEARHLSATPVLAYVVNAIRIGEREIPYSVAAGLPATTLEAATAPSSPRRDLWLNAWAAAELRAKPGDEVTLEFFVWTEDDALQTRTLSAEMSGVLPMDGLGADATLTPEYPGITGRERLTDWDPPFPVDLSRVRDRDEEYWERYGAAPKVFLRLDQARKVWGSRFGSVSSLRLRPTSGGPIDVEAFAAALRTRVDPAAAGFLVNPVRQDGLAAASGTTDFGEYFLYFSFFLVASGLMLAGLFFIVGVELRARQIGLLSAVGFAPSRVRRLLLAEAATLSGAGALAGTALGLGYAALVLRGLTTWWRGAVGTSALELHVAAFPVIAGAAGGLAAALVAVAFALRGVQRRTPRSLLSDAPVAEADARKGSRGRARPKVRRAVAALGLAAGGLVLLLLALAAVVPMAFGFFLGGVLLLAGALLAFSAWLHGTPGTTPIAAGRWALARLGMRQALHRPARSVLSATLIAFATFVLVAVTAFRREGPIDPTAVPSGTGGYTLIGESVVPLLEDPATREGRDALGWAAGNLPPRFSAVRFRLNPGDDASCLNLYRPSSPRIIAPADVGVLSRFRFASTVPDATAHERDDPWVLLDRRFPDGAIPAIADATSLRYVFHLGVGDDLVIARPGATDVRLRFVAALADSLLQSEVIIDEAAFMDLFPRREGYRLFLFDVPPDAVATTIDTIERGLSDYGLDVERTDERLAAYHRVENTYLSTFQALGGLGLILGTVGLAAVLVRNVLERRRELAILQAVGYRRRAVIGIVLAETALLLGVGLLAGAAGALLAIAPAALERPGALPVGTIAMLTAGVAVAGMVSATVAAAAALRLPLLSSLRAG